MDTITSEKAINRDAKDNIAAMSTVPSNQALNEEGEEREPQTFHSLSGYGIGGSLEAEGSIEETEDMIREIMTEQKRVRDMDVEHRESLSFPIKAKKQSSWNTVRKVVHKASICALRGVCSGSMTEAERSFLTMLNNSRAKSTSRIARFADAVDAAVSREKLRKELQARVSKLTSKEAEFLKSLVEDENVTKQQLENADRVLRTDKLYSLEEDDGDSHQQRGMPIGVQQRGMPIDIQQRGMPVDIQQREIPDGLRQRGMPYKEDLDVKIRCEESNIEVYLNGQNYSSRHLLLPSTFTYKTWDLLKDQPTAVPILIDSEEVPESDRVLTPPMIESIRRNLPPVIAEDHFWLKYSMAKNGTSLVSLYNSVRQSTQTLLAIETTDGHVFGGFASSPWRENKDFYGSCEAFLWRLKSSRFTHCYSLEEQASLESNIQIFDWSQKNRNIQMSNRSRIAMGGGIPDEPEDEEDATSWGLGIALDSDLLQGTTNPCITFRSPPLISDSSSRDNIFEISNMEVWAFTPCSNVELAEQLEMGRMFVLSHFESA